MPQLPDKSVDMILCDLPYGTTACKWDTIIPFEPLWAQYKRLIKDNGVIALTASQPFTSALVMSNPENFKYALVWDKGLPTGFQMAKIRPLKQHEDILIFSLNRSTYNPQKVERVKPRIYNRGPAVVGGETLNEVKHDGKDRTLTHYEPRSIFCIPNANNKAKIHPTQKPTELFEYLISTYSNPDEIILDNCAGSFTTAIACINTNRKYICIEKDEHYFNIGSERIRKHIKQLNKESNQSQKGES